MMDTISLTQKKLPPVRLGTVGSGPIVHSFLKQVCTCEDFVLQAIYSRSAEKARALASQYGAASVHTDFEAFLKDPAVDTVYLATPNQLHEAQVRAALLHGKNVLCEKPFVTHLSAARELLELARERGLFLIETVPTSFLPNFQILRDALPALGPIRLVLANYSQYSSRYDLLLAGQKTNMFDPAMAGGCLMDINYYNVYLTTALFGLPQEAHYRPRMFPTVPIDTSGVLQMQYPGFTAVCAGAKDTRGVNAYQIEGERGYLYVENGSNGLAAIRLFTEGTEKTISHQTVPDRFFYEVRALGRILRIGDIAAAEERGQYMLHAVEIVEKARLEAGIRFPGDPSPDANGAVSLP